MKKQAKRSNALTSENLTVLVILLILFVIVILIYFIFHISKYSDAPKMYPDRPDNLVVEVLSGDSFVLNNGETVKLNCVSAPTNDPKKSIESKLFLEGLVLNKNITLDTDIFNKDEYNRLLRYAWINGSNGEMLLVNKYLYQNNHVHLSTLPPIMNSCKEFVKD